MASRAPYQQQQSSRGVGSFSDWVQMRAEEATEAERSRTVRHQEPARAEKSTPAHRVAKARPASGSGHARSHRAHGRSERDPVAKVRLLPQTEHRMARLRPVPAGRDLKTQRRRARFERAIVVISVAAVMSGALVSVVTRAEIAKLQLESDSLQPALSQLATSNAQLSVTYGQLSAPARIAAIAETKLHMVFPAVSQVATAPAAGSTETASGQPLSLYYTPYGESLAPPTTVATASVKAGSSAPAKAGGAATPTTISGATATSIATSNGTAASKSSATGTGNSPSSTSTTTPVLKIISTPTSAG